MRPGPRRLALAPFAPRTAGVFLQLVGTIECRRIGRRGQAGADTEAVDRRAAAASTSGYIRLARRWRRYGPACNPAASRMRRTARAERREVPLSSRTALIVMPSASGAAPVRRRSFAPRSVSYVSISSVRSSGRDPGEASKAVPRHHAPARRSAPGPGHRNGEIRLPAPLRYRKAGQIARARRQQPGFRAMCTPKSEIYQLLPGCREHHAGCLRGDESFENEPG